MLVRPWPRRPGASVALLYAPVDSFSRPEELDAHVVLLERSSTAMNALASAELVPMVETDRAWQLDSPKFELDFAAYEIRSGEFAFIGPSSLRGESTSQVLHLFRQHCARLFDIFHTEVRMDDEQRGPNDHMQLASVLVMAPETTGGFHDIVVRRSFSTAPLDGSSPSTSGSRTERWRWTGARYSR